MSRVLLICEEWQTRVLVRAQLEHEGYEVVGIETVAEGLEELCAWPGAFDAIVVDTHGQGLSTDALRELAASGLPCVALTGPYGYAGSELTGIGFGVVVVRPMFVRDVVAAVRRLLRS